MTITKDLKGIPPKTKMQVLKETAKRVDQLRKQLVCKASLQHDAQGQSLPDQKEYIMLTDESSSDSEMDQDSELNAEEENDVVGNLAGSSAVNGEDVESSYSSSHMIFTWEVLSTHQVVKRRRNHFIKLSVVCNHLLNQSRQYQIKLSKITRKLLKSTKSTVLRSPTCVISMLISWHATLG